MVTERGKGSRNSWLDLFCPQAVRSCVLMIPRPKNVFPVCFVWASCQKGHRSGNKKGKRRSEKNELPQILERPL